MNQNTALAEKAEKVVYAAIGAPLVTGRKIIDLGSKVAGNATDRLETWASEGKKATEKWGADSKKVADQVRTGQVVEEFTARMDLDQIQDRVGKLRDQLEGVLTNWRESFSPEADSKTATVAAKAPAKKATPAKKAPAKKAPATKAAAKAPAKKATPAKKAPAKKAPATKAAAKAPAKKATPAKKAPATKAPATKAPATKAAAKAPAKKATPAKKTVSASK